MTRILYGLLLLLSLSSPGYAADVVVVQAAMRTTTGTQDLTVSGFGTPKAAFCTLTNGTANGTTVSHALISLGATDGTRQWAISGRSKDAVTTTVAGRRANTTDMVLLADQDGTVIVRAQFSAWVTDGIRINVSVAPAAAYLLNCSLFGGSGVSNAYVSTAAGPATQDTGTDVTAPGFQPDLVLVGQAGDHVLGDSNSAQHVLSFGAVQRGGSNPHTQGDLGWEDVSGQTTTALLNRRNTDRVAHDQNASNELELQDFDSSGFTVMTRGAAGARTMGYLALKFSGITAVVTALDSPTGTGSQSFTGLGITPQWGLLTLSALTTSDANENTGGAEVFGVSMFTASAQYSTAITSDDGVTTSNAEAVTDSKPVFLRKDGGTYVSATFTSFGNGTMTLNYGTNGCTSACKWIGVFIQAAATGRRMAPVFFQ